MKTRRDGDRGFTLVELMVSLVAGLIVTIAVVGLARAATTTFFEAARISSVEASVRTASERLRQDLARASYMSTGNIKLARDQAGGVPLGHRIGVPDPTAPSVNGGSRYAALNDLAGIHVIVGGSGNNAAAVSGAGTDGPNALSANNGLNPDAIILGGNYTTNDSYQGTFSVTGGSCPGNQSIALNAAGDAAVRRLVNTADPLASTRAAFTPVPGKRFAARVVDAKGCQHFVVVCAVTATATGALISLESDSAGNPAVMLSGAANHTNCGATNAEPVTINPVQRVRWYVGPNTDATLDPATGVEPATNKFNLYRDLIDAEPIPTPRPETRQIVAEYAADLKSGLAVADAANALQVYDMDTDAGGGGGNIDLYTQLPVTTTAGGPGPQRVRSVRFRIATRAAVPDRNSGLVIGPAPYLTRYCVQNQPAATCKSFARVRTVVSEVALMNQIGMTY